MPDGSRASIHRALCGCEEHGKIEGEQYYAYVGQMTKKLFSSSLDIFHGYGCRVCCRDDRESAWIKPQFPDQFQYFVVDMRDNTVRVDYASTER